MVAAVGFGACALWARAEHRRLSRVLALALVTTLLLPAVTIRWATPAERYVHGAGQLHRTSAGTVLTLAADARPASALRALRTAGVVHLDVVELSSNGATMEAVAAVIERRIPVDRVVVGPSDPDPSDSDPSDSDPSDRGAGGSPIWAGVASPIVQLVLGDREFDITHRAVVMGILNRTPTPSTTRLRTSSSTSFAQGRGTSSSMVPTCWTWAA